MVPAVVAVTTVVAMAVVAARRRHDDDRTTEARTERLVVPGVLRALHHGAGGKAHGCQ